MSSPRRGFVTVSTTPEDANALLGVLCEVTNVAPADICSTQLVHALNYNGILGLEQGLLPFPDYEFETLEFPIDSKGTMQKITKADAHLLKATVACYHHLCTINGGQVSPTRIRHSHFKHWRYSCCQPAEPIVPWEKRKELKKEDKIQIWSKNVKLDA